MWSAALASILAGLIAAARAADGGLGADIRAGGSCAAAATANATSSALLQVRRGVGERISVTDQVSRARVKLAIDGSWIPKGQRVSQLSLTAYAQQFRARAAEARSDGMQRAATKSGGGEPHWLPMGRYGILGTTEPYYAKLALDNNRSTWGGAVDFVVDLGEIHQISKTSIFWRVCTCRDPGAVKLEVSIDGKAWSVYYEPEVYAWGGHVEGMYEASALGRYFRVRPTTVAPVQWVSFWEYALYGFSDGTLKRPNAYGWWHSYWAKESPTIGGTEIVQLHSYKGALFATVGFWMNTGPWQPAKVIRLDCAYCDWVLDGTPSPWATRLEVLTDISFQQPRDDFLMTSFYVNYKGEGRVYYSTREDTSKIWFVTLAYSRRPYREKDFSARAVQFYRDPEDGVERLFCMVGRDGIITATYAPRGVSPTRLKFAPKLEVGPFRSRPLAFAVLDNRLFMSSDSAIWRRNNGPNPTWDTIFDMKTLQPGVVVDEAVGGIRGLTPIANPDSPTGNSMLFTWNPNTRTARGCVMRLDPDSADNHTTFSCTEESCARELAKAYLGKNIQQLEPKPAFIIAGYNNILAVPRKDGGVVHIIGFEMMLYGYTANEFSTDPRQLERKGDTPMVFYSGAPYMIRHSAKAYEMREVGGKRYNPQFQEPSLVATRCYSRSPFPDDDGIYFGGYDANFFPVSNTAWVFRGTAAAVNQEPIPCQPELGCGYTPGTPFGKFGCDLCEGRDFYGWKVSFWHEDVAYSCQEMLNWINTAAQSECEPAKTWDIMTPCCKPKPCKPCRRTGKRFKASNIAGTTKEGHKYTCQVAFDWAADGGASCEDATSWWRSACCEA